ncbi:MAG TPA: hypothetical protein VJJ76_01325 [archaeon]|nr:hypothetical protein [archaeon]
MKSRTRNSSSFLKFAKRHKGQFFVLSAFAIVAMFFLISRWIEPFTIVDTSQVALMDEFFIFNNIKEKAIYAVNGSKSCEDLRYNLDEYRNFVQQYALEKNFKIDFNYTISPCYNEPPFFPVVIEANLRLKSPSADLSSTFGMTYVPS